MKVLIIGCNGQVGKALVRLAPESWNVTGWSRADVDFADTAALRKRLNEHARTHGAPDAIINAAAYTKVDLAESNLIEATQVNVDLPKALAEAAHVWGCPLVHYSTDYVYPGDGDSPYRESDLTGPLNLYGKTKQLGDQAVEASGCDHLIFRVCWVYAATGKNFFLTVLNLAKDKPELRVVADQIGSPTFADDIAGSTLEALQLSLKMPIFPSGVYHLANSGYVSWHGFASAIIEEARALRMPVVTERVVPLQTREYPTPAKRPANSRLDTQKITTVFAIRPRPWQEAMKELVAKVAKGIL